MKRILFVEDDLSLISGLSFAIRKQGYELDIARTSLEAETLWATEIAADEETDIIMGLDIGGDDYITKPFKLAVFLSRINALLRRSSNYNQNDTELNSNFLEASD